MNNITLIDETLEHELKKAERDAWDNSQNPIFNPVEQENWRRKAQQCATTLRRIAEGTYGICCVCHQPINQARLDALPIAETCIQCSRYNN